MADPFASLEAKSKGAFWITGGLWNKLIDTLRRDRVIVVQGGGVSEIVTNSGRAITAGGAVDGGAFSAVLCINGTLTNVELVGTVGDPVE